MLKWGSSTQTGRPRSKGTSAHDLAVAGHQGQLGVDHGHHVGEGRRRPLEDRHRGDVHVADVVLEVEERGILRAQPVGAHRISLHRAVRSRRSRRTSGPRRRPTPRGAARCRFRRQAAATLPSRPRRAKTGSDATRSHRFLVGRLDHPGERSSAMARRPMARRAPRPGLEPDDRGPVRLQAGHLAFHAAVHRPAQQPVGPARLALGGRHGGDHRSRGRALRSASRRRWSPSAPRRRSTPCPSTVTGVK